MRNFEYLCGRRSPLCAQMPRAGARGASLPGEHQCHRPGTDFFEAKGKHLNRLTFELPGMLFTLAARVAVLQILNTVLRVIWGLLKSPPPPGVGGGWGWAGLGTGRPGLPILSEVSGVSSPGTTSQGSLSPCMQIVSVFGAGEPPWGSLGSSTFQPIHLIIRFSVSREWSGVEELEGCLGPAYSFLDLCI